MDDERKSPSPNGSDLSVAGKTRLPVALDANPDTDLEAARKVHRDALPAGVYANSLIRLESMFAEHDLGPSAMLYAADLMERMAPRDPAEEMLVVQMLMAHTRVIRLTDLANRQTELDQLRTINDYADRASNTYRRLMLALAEYRKPPRAGDTITAIQQANIAGQQVVMNGESSRNGNATNEQGREYGRGESEAAPALSSEPRGARVAPIISEASEAVGEIHRAEDG